MKMHNACYPCLVRSALDTARIAAKDEVVQQRIIQRVLAFLATADPAAPPPLMARYIHETIGELTGNLDPYALLKKEFNDMALGLYPGLAGIKAGFDAGTRFETGVRLAIAGNIIDFGIGADLDRNTLLATIDHALKTSVKGSVRQLKDAVKRAAHILWIGDNAGEIVFDKLLLEEMDASKVVYGVRGGPVQNDATMADAAAVGLTRMVRVVDSGAAIPGTLVEHCSEQFLEVFHRADLILAKGQGNFETLDHDDPRIYFLFKAKCPVVAGYAGCDQGDVVIRGPGHL